MGHLWDQRAAGYYNLYGNKDLMAKIMSSLYSDTEFMLLPEYFDFFFFNFRLIFQRTVTWLRHSNVQHLQPQGMWFWDHLLTATSCQIWRFHSSEGLFCGVLHCDTTFSRNNDFSPKELSAYICRVKVSHLTWRSYSTIPVIHNQNTVSWHGTSQAKQLYRFSFLQIPSSLIHAVSMWWAISYLLDI